MSDNEVTTIEEKFLNVGDLFGIEFSDGLVFLEVTGEETNRYKPYSNIGDVAPQTDSGFQRLEDPSGDDILHIPDPDEKVLHAAISQTPPQVRRYTNYPESENRLRTPPNLTVPRASNGDVYGYVDGEMSPYDRPTDAQELVIPPLVNLDFNFYNPDPDKTYEPLLNITFREYNVNVLNPAESQDAVRMAVRPGSPIPFYPAGSIDRQMDMTSKLRKSWGVRPVSREEVKEVVGNV